MSVYTGGGTKLILSHSNAKSNGDFKFENESRVNHKSLFSLNLGLNFQRIIIIWSVNIVFLFPMYMLLGSVIIQILLIFGRQATN